MNDPGPTVIFLPPSLDILGAEPLSRQLRAKILSGEAVIVDGGQVQRIATASVQVLVAALQSARSRGLPFRLLAPSEALIEAFANLGLTDTFADRDP